MEVIKRILSPGRFIAFALTLVLVYYAWGFVFTPGGTGSNVVLGLLLAAAAIYLLTTHLGPYLDDALFFRGDQEALRLKRYASSLFEDVERALKKASKGKGPKKLDEETRSRLEERLQAAREALSEVEPPKAGGRPSAPQLEDLRKRVERLEKEVQVAFGDAPQRSVFGQLRSLGIAFAIALALRAFVVEPFQIPSSSMIPTLLIGDHLFVARFYYGLQMPFSKEPRYLVRWGVPKPGDVVVFVAPPYAGPNAGDAWIKRVIAGPGQRVRMVDTVLYVDDVPYEHLGEPAPVTYMDYDEVSRSWHEERAVHLRERIGEREHDIYLGEPTKHDWPVSGRGVQLELPGLDCNQVECKVKEGHIFVMGDNRDHSSDGRTWGAVPIDNVKGKALFIWMSVDGSERSVDLGRFTLPRFRWERLFQEIE